ncbi:MAG: hypothetical protein WKG00_10120 [Polyangiaceae bacterium]
MNEPYRGRPAWRKALANIAGVTAIAALSTTYGASGTIHTRIGSSSSCGGASQSATCVGCGWQHRVFAVGDMTGDGKMELMVYDFDGTLSWLTSESGYASAGGSRTIDPDVTVL